MPGAILQLVSNSSSIHTRWLDQDPQITHFKKIYRRHSPFSIEHVKIPMTNLDFNGGGNVILLPHGDLINRCFLSFDIPYMAAAFLNLKTSDIITVINDSVISDKIFASTIRKYISGEDVQVSHIQNTTASTLVCYNKEEQTRLHILDQLATYQDPIGYSATEITLQPTKPSKILIGDDQIYSFVDFKMNLANEWLTQKKDYYLSYNLLKFVYESTLNTLRNNPLLDTNLISNVLMYSSFFYNILPNREILALYYIKHLDFTNVSQQNTNSLIETFDIKLTEQYDLLIGNEDIPDNAIFKTNFQYYQFLYSIFSTDPIPIVNPDFLLNTTTTDTYTLLQQMTFAVNNNYTLLPTIQKQFYDFGPSFYYLLNSYDTIIDILDNLATTVPVVIAKAFAFQTTPVSIYTDNSATLLKSTIYPTVLDPNFQITDTKQIYPNSFVNEYLQLINDQSSYMYNNLENGMNLLFETYRGRLFSTTRTLFFMNTPPLTNIYDYLVPNMGFQNNASKRISNVFNANIWFFYFFKYLDTFDEYNFTNYAVANTSLAKINMTSNEILFMESIITLLKRNLDNYMREISYMLNNLYATAPSTNPNDSMKNYVPASYGATLNGVNIVTDVLGVTMIFHRNHVQTILELFQYMYYFIDHCTIQQLNTYLGTTIQPISDSTMNTIRSMVKLMYYAIFKYFMDIYDAFRFEAPANFSMNEYNPIDVAVLVRYANYFLTGTYIPLTANQIQVPLTNYVGQMEFYFTSEMLNMREQEKFYYNCVFNDKLISDTVGNTTAVLIRMVMKYFDALNAPIDIAKFQTCPDRVRNYWDMLYRRNVNYGLPDNLYYATFDIDRYNGRPYELTSYPSRDYGCVNAPLLPPSPMPPTDPYGINPSYYNPRQRADRNTTVFGDVQIPETNIPVYWINNSILQPTEYNTKTSIDTDEFQIFRTDYFRIKHSVLHQHHKKNKKKKLFIDAYQLNLLKIISLTQQLNVSYPVRDSILIQWVWSTLHELLHTTNPFVPYTSYLHVYNLGSNPTLYDMLDVYYSTITNELTYPNANLVSFPQTLLLESLNGVNEMFSDFNAGIQIETPHQQSPYTYQTLIKANAYTYNEIIQKVDCNYNIIDKIKIAKDNFLSEYFYYVKYETSINNVNNINQINNTAIGVPQNNSFYFKNISRITYDILSETNYNNADLTPLEESSTLTFFYPDAFITKVDQIKLMVTTLDDFSQNMSATLLSLISPGTSSRLTIKDLYDLINTTFSSIKQSYAYCITNCVFDYVFNILEKYQTVMLNKISLFSDITKYLTAIPGDRKMTTLDSAHIANMAAAFGIDYQDYYNYLNANILIPFNHAKIGTADIYPYQRLTIVDVILNSQLDYFFIKWVIGDATATPYIAFKDYVIEQIFTPDFLVDHQLLLLFFKLVSSGNYPFIYTFFNYVITEQLPLESIINPIAIFDQNDLLHDQEVIALYYRSFYTLSDALEYFMDLIWDWTMTICNNNPSVIINDFGYSNRPSILVNQIHLEYELNATEKANQMIQDEILAARERITTQSDNLTMARKRHINELVGTTIIPETIVDETTSVYKYTNDYYFSKLIERAKIIEFMKDVCCRGIVLIQSRRDELISIQNRLYNILYRNKRAKMAWVRKLAHFLVKEVTIRNDDQILDSHPSDWLEIFHEISKQDGSESGYNKMIGFREDLVVYDDKLKNAYNIILPLIFYCNRNAICALPLNASINTRYEITVKLRPLHEVTYKEEFSDFIDPTLYEFVNNPNTVLEPFIPKITNANLTGEYIYLTTEERKIFVSNILEYIMEELQDDDGFNVTDKQLNPIYKIATTINNVTSIQNGRKITEDFYDTHQGIYVDQQELDNIIHEDNNYLKTSNCQTSSCSANKKQTVRSCVNTCQPVDYTKLGMDLLPRNDYVLEPHVDRTGVSKLKMINKPLCELDPDLDPNVHRKRITYRHYFSNPSELLSMVIKMDIHTLPSARVNEKMYFFGEYQWDNYGLYSYYDLTEIYDAKQQYYECLQTKLDNPDDCVYGVIKVINRLLLQYTTEPIIITNNFEQWIANNLEEFLATLQRIKEAYLSYCCVFVNNEQIIRIKENLMFLALNYDIWQDEFLFQLVTDIFDQLGITPVPSDQEIIDVYASFIPNFDIFNFIMHKSTFQEGVMIMLSRYVSPGQNPSQANTDQVLTIGAIVEAINLIYTDYNETEINYLISIMAESFDLAILTYSFVNFMDYFYNLYNLKTDAVPAILAMLVKINEAINLRPVGEFALQDSYPIQNLFYKNIIYQIIPLIKIPDPNQLEDYLTLIPFKVLSVVTFKMNDEVNHIINTRPVNLINYQEHMKLNPKINPLISGYLTFNSYNIMPVTSDGLAWSELEAFKYLLHTPSTGINLHSWSLNPLLSQDQGSANLTRIDEFKSVYDLHPLIGNKYPATIRTIILSINLLRCMSGLTGKAWEFGSFKR